jgi:hypothetical protein
MLIQSMLVAAALQASPMEPLFQYALESTTPQGSYLTFFNRDGTYTTNVGISGTWEVRGNELCVRRSTGEGGCTAMQQGIQPGSTWQAVNPTTGQTVTYRIVPRQ